MNLILVNRNLFNLKFLDDLAKQSVQRQGNLIDYNLYNDGYVLFRFRNISYCFYFFAEGRGSNSKRQEVLCVGKARGGPAGCRYACNRPGVDFKY